MNRPFAFLLLLAIVAFCDGCIVNQEKVEAVILPPNILKSEIYSVRANGMDIPVGHEISNDSVFETTAFMAEGKVKVEIEVPAKIDQYSIHPLSKSIVAKRNGAKLSFTIDQPSNLLVKINNLTPLLIFSTPTELEVPDENEDDVIFFGPGEHDVGRLMLKSNQTVYLAAGATVYGTLEGENVHNVRILGRGILDGSKHTSWDERIFGIYFERSKNITIEGIGIRNCYWWVTHFLLCDNVDISHINLFSYYRNNGGLMLDGCNNYTARNSFILTNDDCICPHALNAAGNGEPVAQNYSFTDMVLYNVLTGNGIRIGASFETQRCRDWIFEDIDLLAHNPRGAAIISDHSDWAMMENLQFVNFNVERSSPRIINFFIDSTRYSCFTGYNNERGNLRQVVFSNFNAPGGEVYFNGHDPEHMIQDVWFQNFAVSGKILQSLNDITTNDFVQNVHFVEDDVKYQPTENNEEYVTKTTSPAELTLDDESPESRFVGFDYVAGEEGFINSNYHKATVPEGFSNFKAAIYEPKITGKYEVYLHWKAIKNGATNAKWIVHHRDGYNTRYLNQRTSEGWHLHGTYHLDGTSSVRLSLPGYFQIADGTVVADAVKFVRID